jgi:outer membrane protein assembly factor BamB
MIPTRMMQAVVLALLLGSVAHAQISRTQIYSRPALPSEEVLRRLNLTLAWSTAVPMDGRRDGILRVQMDREDLIVLTRSGQVACIDAETGVQKWRSRVGKPYTLVPVYTANSRSAYVIANATIFGLNRATGSQKWEDALPAGLAAAPVADEENIYIPSANTYLYAYGLPFVEASEARATALRISGATSAYATGVTVDLATTRRPRAVWQEPTNIELAFKPLLYGDYLFVVSPSGQAIGFTRYIPEGFISPQLFRFATEGKILVPPGQFGNVAYIGSEDASLYAIPISSGRLRWRYSAGTAIIRQPIALEKDIYITSERNGLARIDRATGEAMWKIPSGRNFLPANSEADRFLAASERYVYATDLSNRLLILDRKRGTVLSMLPTYNYRFPVVNDTTDRLYLAANDGLILCLHDRYQTSPLRHKASVEAASSPILKLLEQKVSEAGGKPVRLEEALAKYTKDFKIRFRIVERAFREAGDPRIKDREVKPPRSEERPLKELLQLLLKQVNATYQVVEDVVLIVPAGRR